MIPFVLSSQVQKGVNDFLGTTFPVSTPFFHGMMNHPLHEKIGDLIEGAFKDYRDLKIVKDPACCWGKSNLQQISLFRTDQESRHMRYCCVP